MSDKDDSDTTDPDEGLPPGTWTIPEQVARYSATSPELQRFWLRKLVEVDPSVALEAVFPRYRPGYRNDVVRELDRLRARREAEELFEEETLSGSEGGEVTDLSELVEALENGSEERPRPSVGELLYAERVNGVYGNYTAGKTWFSLYLAKLNMEEGGSTLLVDYEDSALGIADRCRMLHPKLAGAVAHYRPPAGAVPVDDLRDIIEERGVTLVIIDSTGEALAAAGCNPNSDEEVARWFRTVPDALAELGPAMLLLDHIAKKNDGTPTPVGSFRKGAAITGAQFVLENKVGFSRMYEGWSQLTCTKDRCGYYATGQVVGRVEFKPQDDGGLKVQLRRGDVEVVDEFDSYERSVMEHVRRRMYEVHGKPDPDNPSGPALDGRQTLTEIRREVGRDSGKVGTAIKSLERRNYLVIEHLKQGKGTRDVYKLAPPDFHPVDPEADENSV